MCGPLPLQEFLRGSNRRDDIPLFYRGGRELASDSPQGPQRSPGPTPSSLYLLCCAYLARMTFHEALAGQGRKVLSVPQACPQTESRNKCCVCLIKHLALVSVGGRARTGVASPGPPAAQVEGGVGQSPRAWQGAPAAVDFEEKSKDFLMTQPSLMFPDSCSGIHQVFFSPHQGIKDTSSH